MQLIRLEARSLFFKKIAAWNFLYLKTWKGEKKTKQNRDSRRPFTPAKISGLSVGQCVYTWPSWDRSESYWAPEWGWAQLIIICGSSVVWNSVAFVWKTCTFIAFQSVFQSVIPGSYFDIKLRDQCYLYQELSHPRFVLVSNCILTFCHPHSITSKWFTHLSIDSEWDVNVQ